MMLIDDLLFDDLIGPNDGMKCVIVSDLLIFDNQFSWVNSKCVHYKLEVVEPCEDLDSGNLLTTLRGNTTTLESTHL